MNLRIALTLLSCLTIAACVSGGPTMDHASLADQVRAAETAFAKTMADRDLAAFESHIADDAVFFTGPEPFRGKRQVVDGWARFFAKPDAPFSWAPEQVEVLQSGTLALSTGPVRDPAGNLVARFTSIWRLEKNGQWQVVFDKGCDVCATADQ